MPLKNLNLPIDRMVLGALAGAALGSGKLPKGIGSHALAKFLEPLSTNDKAVGMVAAVMARDEASDRDEFAWEKLSADERAKWKRRAKSAIRAFTVLAAQAAAGAAKASKPKSEE